MAQYDYDLFVIGGGSGGVRGGRLAASLGKRVAVAEADRFGGTCVIRGCVPKKLFVYASQVSEHIEDAAGYGWTIGESRFDWPTLIANKDKEIARLEGLYQKGLNNAGATVIASRASLVGPHEVLLEATGETVTAENILIAVGGAPNPHEALPGHEHCITSDQAFDLAALPKDVIVAGGGYIAVEFANIFYGLGVDTTILYRGQELLGGFDVDVRLALHEAMEAKGIKVGLHSVMENVEKLANGRLKATLNDGSTREVDQIMLALGRHPLTPALGLDRAGVEVDARGNIVVDDYSRTSQEHIFAVGDVTNRVALTPVAIHEAMCVIETLYKGRPTKPDHATIGTAVFSQPEIGTVGLSEDDAIKAYEHVEIYKASFRPMKNILPGRNEKMLVKLVVDGKSKRVIGAHIFGPDAGELAQVLGICVKAQLTKADFDQTMAIHPTAAEELVTMYSPSYECRDGKRVG